jgi:hypothetical protein
MIASVSYNFLVYYTFSIENRAKQAMLLWNGKIRNTAHCLLSPATSIFIPANTDLFDDMAMPLCKLAPYYFLLAS